MNRIVALVGAALVLAACGGGGGGGGDTTPPSTPSLSLSSASLSFSATAGGATPAAQLVTASNSGSGTLAVPTTSVSYGSGTGWLNVSMTGSAAPFTVSVQPVTAGLAAGTYTATVSVASSGATGSPKAVAVTLSVTAAPPRTLAGTITYSKVNPTAAGLDYANTFQLPVRGVQVELLDAGTNGLVTSGLTDSTGHFNFTWAAAGARFVKVRIKALTATPVIRVEDNTNGDALWAADSAQFDSNSGSALSLNLPSGWGGSGYTGTRSAAPFAVLDAAYTVAQAFLAERPVVFPDLKINWSPDNRPERGDKALGQIGTSHWDLSELYILGKENIDTDEYDSHIIAHEWGHYFESKLSRSDSPGGAHGYGDLKDPRLAWGEGWATALGAITLYPNVMYTDTVEAQQALASQTDIENNADGDLTPGWFSEASVLHVFFDLWDPASVAEPFDTASLSLGALYDVMVGGQKTTPAFTTIFSFIDALKTANPAQATAIDSLLAHRGVAAPVADPGGSGETNDGGLAGVLPVYNALVINGSVVSLTFTSVGADPEAAGNSLGTNRFAVFLGDGTTVSIAAASSGPEVLLKVFRSGQELANAVGTPGAGISLQTTAGTVYTIIVTSTDVTPGNAFTGAVLVTSP